MQGGYFNNVKNIEVTTAMNKNRVVHINGGAGQFGTLSATALNGQTQYNVYMKANFNPKERDITRLFNPDVILLGTVTHNGKQLYYFEQAADFVPFKTGDGGQLRAARAARTRPTSSCSTSTAWPSAESSLRPMRLPIPRSMP